MKKLLPLVLTLLVLQSARAGLLLEDHFSYSDGNLFSVAAGVWAAGGSAGAEFTVTTNAALVSPAGFAAASGKGVRWAPSGTARRNLAQFTAVSNTDGNTVYASFLLSVATAPGSSRLFAYFDNTTSSTTSPQLGIFLNGSTVGIGKKAGSPAVTAALSAGAHLVVVRYTFLASGNDQADLWVDPSTNSYGATTAPASLGSTTGGSDPSSLYYFAINASSGAGPILYIDELRLGTTWADVTPAGSAPPPPPVSGLSITQAFLHPAGFVLRGAGGSPTGTCFVLSTTDLTTSAGNWPAIATNQFDSSGSFDCTNPISPLDARRFYRVQLAGTNAPPPPPPGAPSITSQPQGLAVAEGGTAMLNVVATGTPPLSYRWYFNTSSPVAGATNATLALTNVSTNDTGFYSVIVSNGGGTATSDFAPLTVNPASTNGPDFQMAGFATLGGGTTGGAGGATTNVSNAAELEAALNAHVPLIVQVQGTLSIGTIDSKPDKTIIGLGTDATIIGTLKLTHTTNIIVRNLTFQGATDDGITVQQSHRIWLDHCTFIDSGDGEVDITHASEWVTVSWCKFYYTADYGHNFVNLIGHDDSSAAEDTGHLHVTFHHNWWSAYCIERMPRVRFGQVHVFNNYFNASVANVVTNHYCARAAIGSQLLIENNFYENVRTPWEVYITPAGGPDGQILARNNNIGFLDTSFGVLWGTTTTNADHTIDLIVPGTNTVFTPPYSYGMGPVSALPGVVTNNAGAARGPFSP